MEIGIGYPGMFPGIRKEFAAQWARRAEEVGFSSLSTGERLACDCNDFLVSMAMVGAVTSRIRLMSTVMVLPLHDTAIVGKQAATLDVLTEGRFVLGVGVGNRPDDYAAAERAYERRGARFEEQLTELKAQWSGGAIGPPPHTPGGPRILLGPTTPKTARRVALADGLATYGSPDPEAHTVLYDAALDAWQEAGREGRPYFAAGMYFALGPDAAAKSRQYVDWYYSYLVSDELAAMFDRITLSESALADTLAAFDEAGVDEFYLCPLIAELDQIERLVDVLGTLERRS